MRRFVVICEWESGLTIDADQIAVYANSQESALEKARKKWRLTIGAEWPDCRLGKVFVATPARSTKSV